MAAAEWRCARFPVRGDLTDGDAICYNACMTQVAINLTDELTAFVESSVESGLFHNASEMVANALHTLKGDAHAKWEALRADIALGIAQADRGEFVAFDANSIKEELGLSDDLRN